MAYDIASVDEVHPVVMTWLAPFSPKRTFKSLESDPITPVGTQNKLILLYCWWKKSRYCSSVNSCEPPPLPMIIPKRWRSESGREAGATPAVAQASVAPQEAMGRTRE